MEKIMKLFIEANGLSKGIGYQTVFEMWDKVSGAAQFTLRKFYRDGVLYVTVSSSVVRNQLYFQRETLVGLINEELSKDPLYNVQKNGLVKSIVLK